MLPLLGWFIYITGAAEIVVNSSIITIPRSWWLFSQVKGSHEFCIIGCLTLIHFPCFRVISIWRFILDKRNLLHTPSGIMLHGLYNISARPIRL